MMLLEKIVKVAKLEEEAENCTDQDCNSIMETLLQISLGGKAHGFNRGMKAFFILKNVYISIVFIHIL